MQCLLESWFICRQKLKYSICHSDSAVFIFLALTVQLCSESLLIYWLLKYLYWIGWQGLWFGIWDLGFDRDLDLRSHINNICRNASLIIRNIGHVRKYISQADSLLYGLPARDLDQLQRIQNTAARLLATLSPVPSATTTRILFSETFTGYP